MKELIERYNDGDKTISIYRTQDADLPYSPWSYSVSYKGEIIDQQDNIIGDYHDVARRAEAVKVADGYTYKQLMELEK
jgi:hypothetical protein